MKIFFFSKNSFEGQWPDEEVVLLLRRHWIVLFFLLMSSLVLALVPLVFLFTPVDFFNINDNPTLFLFFVSVYYIVWWQLTFYRLMLYLLDVWIITNHRVIDSRQKGFFNRTVSEMKIFKVQDISVEMVGFFATFFNFGNLEIQTAGTEEKFIFEQVPNPAAVKNVIMRTNKNYLEKHSDLVI